MQQQRQCQTQDSLFAVHDRRVAFEHPKRQVQSKQVSTTAALTSKPEGEESRMKARLGNQGTAVDKKGHGIPRPTYRNRHPATRRELHGVPRIRVHLQARELEREREIERQQHPCSERFAKPWSGLKPRAAVFRS